MIFNPAMIPIQEDAQFQQLEKYLQSSLPKGSAVVFRTEPTEAMLVMRDGCADLMFKREEDRISCSAYTFIASDLREQMKEIVKESPVKVVMPFDSHMRPEGR